MTIDPRCLMCRDQTLYSGQFCEYCSNGVTRLSYLFNEMNVEDLRISKSRDGWDVSVETEAGDEGGGTGSDLEDAIKEALKFTQMAAECRQ